jgi:radical SAM superfamily enzyme YgiQ (UPF0313 family)
MRNVLLLHGVYIVSKIAIIKIHPGLNMALPQLSGDLARAGHTTRMFFFKDYIFERDYIGSAFTVDRSIDQLVDETAVFDETYEALAQRLEHFKPHAIGLSVISLSIPEAIKTTRFLRSRFDVPILWGGVGTTLEPEIAIEYADLVCVGEGEEVLVEFADCLDTGADWLHIEGTWTRATDGTVIKNPKRAVGSLDKIAIPDWDYKKMAYVTERKTIMGLQAHQRVTGRDYQIMTQRGCPFSCSFCIESRYQEMFGKKNSLRRRSIDLVIEELVRAKEDYQPTVVWFWDDVFTVNPRWLHEFLPRYKAEVDIPFWCYTYPTTHKLELLQELKAAGCNCISMGIQSGSERILEDVYNRPTPLARVIEASQEIIDAGIIGYFDLISKSSFETEEDLRATYNFLIDLPQEMVYLGAGDMKSYPTYAYSRQEKAAHSDGVLASSTKVDDKTYEYYHNLYWVARNPFISKEEKREIGNTAAFRDKSELLKQYIYHQPTFEDGLRDMRLAVISGEHPHNMHSIPVYHHLPVANHPLLASI